MDQAPVNSFEACCTAIVGDMAKALGERSGETPGRGVARAQGAAMMIMAFLPRDVIEANEVALRARWKIDDEARARIQAALAQVPATRLAG